MLASAGIVGLAASLTARPTIENLVAGLQIALTEAIRLEDVVIANGEWGRIEDISATHLGSTPGDPACQLFHPDAI